MTRPDDPHRSEGTVVELRGLTLRAGTQVLLENARARFDPGQVTLIVGASGVGKSLLLRVLAGLVDGSSTELQVEGELRFADRLVSANDNGDRSVGVVFQQFALFDELSPTDNVQFAWAHRARCVGLNSELDSSRPKRLLAELRVPTGVKSALLSGGQRRRLAIARTIAADPEVVLYDEPTGGLDVATAARVASLILATHTNHPKTSIIVTHDYTALAPIADRIYLLDPQTRALRAIERSDWHRLGELLHLPEHPEGRADDPAPPDGARANRSWHLLLAFRAAAGSFLAATGRALEQAVSLPYRLLPLWRSGLWGFRFLAHYVSLVADLSAWLYLAVAGAIVGFVATYFTFRFLPYRPYTEPLVIENLLGALGFALYRILVPVLGTVLIAARCGAAVASDVGGKSYGQQLDAMRTLGAEPARYLLTGILYAFLLGTPLLVGISFLTARLTSLLVFAMSHPEFGPFFWETHFHRELILPGAALYRGTGWLLVKLLLAALGIGQIAYHHATRPKHSPRDVSRGITATILWATLYVLLVHFAFAFVEFEP